MTLDDRARHAAEAVRESVASAELMLFEAGVPGARKSERPTARVRALAFGGAFAVVVLVVGLSLLPGRLFAPDDSRVAGQSAQPTGQDVVIVPPEDRVPPGAVSPNSVGTQAPPGVVDGRFDQVLNLTIVSPFDGEEVSDESVTFSGTVAPGSRVFARTADLAEAEVDAEGNWSIRLLVQAPATNARFFAEDTAGNQSSDVSVTVIYTPPSPDATFVPDPPEDDPSEGPSDDDQSASEGIPPTVAFTASQEFGSGSREEAFDIYSGTATPDDRIRVGSDYGQGGERADVAGEWSIRVPFRQAPLGEPFTVTVTNLETGESFEFEFTPTS